MRTLQAQRHKKQTEYEYKYRREIIDQIWEEADAEAIKLDGLLTDPRKGDRTEAFKQVFEEYREEDDAVYFEAGFIEW